MSFWPTDIFTNNILSPRDIMQRAGDELTTRTKVLSVSIRESYLQDRVALGFVITNTIHRIEFNLFEVFHGLRQFYPVLIDPPVSDIPEFLKREHHVPGFPGVASYSSLSLPPYAGTPGKTVTNEWVCATPEEFTDKLKKMLASDDVKSSIVSLLTPLSVVMPHGHPFGGPHTQFSGGEHEDEPPEEN